MTIIRANIIKEQITEHEQAINRLTDLIGDLMELHRIGKTIIDFQINQAVTILRLLIKEWKDMTSTISVKTAQGAIAMPVMHKNGALQVVQVQTKAPEMVFYNTTHSNGLRLPHTDTDVLDDAILICDWCAVNFPEFTLENLNTANISLARQKQFKSTIENYRLVELRDWEREDEYE